jgi:uncharacterized protein (DUF1684 family)
MPTCGGSQRFVVLDTDAVGPRRDGSRVTQPSRQIDHRRGAGYIRSITAARQAKDASFRTAADSPLRRAGTDVHGLSYFPVDERYRIVLARLRPPTSR